MPDFALEQAARSGGVQGPIFGIDEVGRGPWAGPVVACAACLFERPAPAAFLNALADSKALAKARREALAPDIEKHALVALGEASVDEIDRLNILQASLLAMTRAATALSEAMGAAPGLCLVDGNRAPAMPFPVQTVVKGDGISASIAAASIFAKVSRDRHMATLASQHPGYGWESNAGYGVNVHKQGLQRLGITIHHRRTFKPIAKLLTQRDS